MPTLKYPSDLNCERIVLGSIFLTSALMDDLRHQIGTNHFSTEQHKRIWIAMCNVYDRGNTVDRVTVFSELQDRGWAESGGGLSYLISLDEGLPVLEHHLEQYLKILGEKARLRYLMALGDDTLKRATAEQETSEEIIASILERIDGEKALDRRPIACKQVIDKKGIDEVMKATRVEGVRLPWNKLNDVLCGFRPGQMIVLAADTGRGKTSMALQIGCHATRQGFAPLIWTMEMSAVQLMRRMICQMSGINSDHMRHGSLTPEEVALAKTQAQWIYDHPVWFDQHSRNVASFCASIRQIATQRAVGLAIVDYLQLIRGAGRNENRAQEVSANSRALKLAAMDAGIPILVLSQFRRLAGESATIHSLKESGDIENDADVILLINCPETEGKDAVTATVKIGKQREGPAGFDIPLEFRPASQSFHSIEDA